MRKIALILAFVAFSGVTSAVAPERHDVVLVHDKSECSVFTASSDFVVSAVQFDACEIAVNQVNVISFHYTSSVSLLEGFKADGNVIKRPDKSCDILCINSEVKFYTHTLAVRYHDHNIPPAPWLECIPLNKRTQPPK